MTRAHFDPVPSTCTASRARTSSESTETSTSGRSHLGDRRVSRRPSSLHRHAEAPTPGDGPAAPFGSRGEPLGIPLGAVPRDRDRHGGPQHLVLSPDSSGGGSLTGTSFEGSLTDIDGRGWLASPPLSDESGLGGPGGPDGSLCGTGGDPNGGRAEVMAFSAYAACRLLNTTLRDSVRAPCSAMSYGVIGSPGGRLRGWLGGCVSGWKGGCG